MTRKEKLYEIIDSLDESVKLIGYALVDRMVHLETNLLELEKLPFIQVHPSNPFKQRELPARKMYIPLLQQYNITIKTILNLVGVNADGDDEALKEFKKYLSQLNGLLASEED